MKRPLRLLSALLALCVLTTAFPPVGRAEGTIHEITGTQDPEAYINSDQVSSRDTIRIATKSATIQHQYDTPWVIEKEVIIEGTTSDANIEIGAGGILLGANVTFRNVGLSFNGNTRNAVIANGYELTLEDVRCTNASFNLFCGGLEDSNNEGLTLPTRGSKGVLNISGGTTLQGKDTWGSGNIYAGNLSMGGMTPETCHINAPPNTFEGNAVINISGSADSTALGTVYACGAQNKNPEPAVPGETAPATKRTYPDPNSYTVSGTVSVSGKVPSVNGAGSLATNVIYQGSESQATRTFENISSLSVESGNLVLGSESSFRGQPVLSVLPGTFLNVGEMSDPTIWDFHGGGSLILGQNQILTIENEVSEKTTIGIGGIFSGASSSSPTLDHTYIFAPSSTADSFALAPPNIVNPPVLVFDNGKWTASSGSSGESINRVTDFKIIPDKVSITMAEDANIPMDATFETEKLPFLCFVPLTISIDEKDLISTEDPVTGYYTYTYQSGVLKITVDDDNRLCVTPDRQYSADTYQIRVTIPPKYNGAGQILTDTVTLTVTDGGGTPDPGPVYIDVPPGENRPVLDGRGTNRRGRRRGLHPHRPHRERRRQLRGRRRAERGVPVDRRLRRESNDSVEHREGPGPSPAGESRRDSPQLRPDRGRQNHRHHHRDGVRAGRGL